MAVTPKGAGCPYYIAAHCKEAVKHRLLTKGGEQEMLFIPEGDIYRLAAKSELPGRRGSSGG